MTTAPSAPLFDRVALIGVGLIGSSLARAIKRHGLARTLVVADQGEGVAARALALGLCDEAGEDAVAAVRGADLVMLCTPVGAGEAIARAIGPALAPGAIVSDVGSVKARVIEMIAPHLPAGVHLVPGHPVAGTEKSGPESGFAELFEGRWCILTPLPTTDARAVDKVAELWRRVGMVIETMDPDTHDKVLAITSHLPHLIAYTIVGTAADLEDHLSQKVIAFSAGGFRDFTRIAGSDPVMWRDVFLNNREAVLEILQRFTEDLTALQRAIRWGEGDTLEALFTKTRAIRQAVIEAKQA
ncbi:cyclohexadienyl dehydrogenase [Rhodospirillum rubrum]|uniref:prephenate/arogenate dehydrogenase family protein n=1 Tax=Rhodospirillum rubrum TaxID=1085 RepID=UPI001902F624|nr:prephenate/arogenate dehydrogenase family protein [Rhodospirillum rubrum]MBK1665539.1 cyclohexadienyl dehydrogenase [Rhodospirillum rubrum]MBK1678213.1 cyclohexadienyl dehydrogenase [Rhodospirillum rubrum]